MKMSGGTSIFSYSAVLGGKPLALSKFSDQVIVIANTASMCGFASSNMQQLGHIQEKYVSQRFTVLAFPCSQFARQEPKSNEEIILWAKEWKANFPIFDKVKVRGSDAHPLFQMLQATLGPIRWNFTKFVCDRHGVPQLKIPPTGSLEELERAVERLC